MSGLGRLVLVGTPIGNREDLSPRARRAILQADVLMCEDTRSPLRLLGDDAVDLPPRVSCFVGNEHARVERLREALRAGQEVAFVSEAGMPVWSDPGRLLVEAAWELGAEVDTVPGPTAAASALVLSGFAAEGAVFVGFVERGGKSRREHLAALLANGATLIFYEAGNRTPALLRDLASACATDGDDARRVLVARELTKKHQELLRAPLADLASSQEDALRGEVCVVLEGRGEHEGRADELDPAQQGARAALDLCLDAGLKPRARAKALAAITGWDAKDLYTRLQEARASAKPNTNDA